MTPLLKYIGSTIHAHLQLETARIWSQINGITHPYFDKKSGLAAVTVTKGWQLNLQRSQDQVLH